MSLPFYNKAKSRWDGHRPMGLSRLMSKTGRQEVSLFFFPWPLISF